jgi:methylated-DNA-[protein]-cysteine S-methyltransferase
LERRSFVIYTCTLDTPVGAVRAGQTVGGAVGHNPISLVIPCHRVLGTDGGLSGYAGGLEKKRALLELEGRKAG